MKFEKGREKTGGRKAGTPNKLNGNIRSRLEEILDGQTNTLEADLLELSPKDRVRAYTELLKFILPTLKEIETTSDCPELPLFLDIPVEKIKEGYGL